MEEKSLVEQMTPYASVLAVIEDGSVDEIIERHVEQATRAPWTPSKG